MMRNGEKEGGNGAVDKGVQKSTKENNYYIHRVKWLTGRR